MDLKAVKNLLNAARETKSLDMSYEDIDKWIKLFQ